MAMLLSEINRPRRVGALSLNSYRVALIGVPKSGKTTYLTMLNKFFQDGNGFSDGWLCSMSSLKDSEDLDEFYTELADPDTSWPQGTRLDNIKEWTFLCNVRKSLVTYPILEVNYLDLAGEWIIPGGGKPPELKDRAYKAIADARAVLFLIDGGKLLQMLEGEISEAEFYEHNIAPAMRFVNQCKGPVHIVISKWDVIPRSYSLRDVSDRLLKMQSDWLRKLKNKWEYQRNGPLRLIPMSSLKEFAYLDRDGTMAKRKDTVPQPLNIDVPLAALLPDYFINRAIKTKPTAAPGQVKVQLPGQDHRSSLAAMFVLGLFGLYAAGLELKKEIDRKQLPIRRRLAGKVAPDFDKVHNAVSAFLYSIASVAERLRKFEKRFPGSRLL